MPPTNEAVAPNTVGFASVASSSQPCPPAAIWWQPLINLGLPRSGTTSFSIATTQIGMHALHNCDSHSAHPLANLGPCFFHGYPATCIGASERRAIDRKGGISRNMTSFDSLADSPYFMLDPQAVRRSYPNARLVCTTRSRESWIKSNVAFFEEKKIPAGSLPFTIFIKHRMGRFAHARFSHQPIPKDMAVYFDLHANETCAGLPLIRTEDSDADKWAVLCAAVPPRWKEACAQWSATGAPWPRTNAMPMANTANAKQPNSTTFPAPPKRLAGPGLERT